jgi:hypothetical protein
LATYLPSSSASFQSALFEKTGESEFLLQMAAYVVPDCVPCSTRIAKNREIRNRLPEADESRDGRSSTLTGLISKKTDWAKAAHTPRKTTPGAVFAAYAVVLTGCLFQRGSPESQIGPSRQRSETHHWRVPAGTRGWIRTVYTPISASRSLASLSARLHWSRGVADGGPGVMDWLACVASPRISADAPFWFESFQNCRARFLSNRRF